MVVVVVVVAVILIIIIIIMMSIIVNIILMIADSFNILIISKEVGMHPNFKNSRYISVVRHLMQCTWDFP